MINHIVCSVTQHWNGSEAGGDLVLIYYFSNSWIIYEVEKKRTSQPWRRFGYPVLIRIDFDDFTSPFTPQFFDRQDISNTRDSVSSAIQTPRISCNTPLRVVFSTLLSVFEFPDETLSLVFDILPHCFFVYSRTSCKRPPKMSSLGGRLQEVVAYRK